MQEAYGPRGTSGSVAAGEEATLTSVAYQLGYTVKDAGVDFQVPHSALSRFVCINLMSIPPTIAWLMLDARALSLPA